MKVKVPDIPEEGLEIKERVSLRLNEGETPAELDLHVTRKGAEVQIEGRIGARVELTCGRCLGQFLREFDLPVDMVYHPVSEMKEEKYELKPDELETGFYADDEIDIGALAAEHLILSLPMRPLCEEACRGICPRCGANLNEVQCGCALEEASGASKFADLKKFMKERS